jgi:hypothetical protein
MNSIKNPSNNNMKVLNVTTDYGRLGNNLIIFFNAIYLSKKYEVSYICFTMNRQNIYYPECYNIITKSFEDSIQLKKHINVQYINIDAYKIFHLSSFLEDDNIIDFYAYKNLVREYFPSIKKITEYNDNQIIDKIINSIDLDKTLFTHIKFTDNMLFNTHIKYVVYPVNLLIYLLKKYNFKNCIITTDNTYTNNIYFKCLGEKCQKLGIGLRILCSENIWDDFFLLSEAKHILLDISTFTWTSTLISQNKQNIIVWEEFFTKFVKALKQYQDVILFNDRHIRENYKLFTLKNYIQCGEWYANNDNIKLMMNWTAKNQITILDCLNQQKYSDSKNVENLIKKKNKIHTNHIALIGPGIMSIPPDGWGAVEILIWEYYNHLKTLGWDVDIINTPNRHEVLEQVNKQKYSFIHLHYDVFYDLLEKIDTPHIAITSHYPYIDKSNKHDDDDDYKQIFDFLSNQNKYYNLTLSEKDTQAFIKNGANTDLIHQIKNGANPVRFKVSDNPIHHDKTICLGWITERKRQYFIQNQQNSQNIWRKQIYFAGRPSDNKFDYNDPNFLGEWKKEEVYKNLTEYGNLVLLSHGEADPLVVKEALMAGCGIVISELSTAHLDTSKPWIDVLPQSKENDFDFIMDLIIKNREISLKHRNDIRKYAEDNFSTLKIVSNYSNWLKVKLELDDNLISIHKQLDVSENLETNNTTNTTNTTNTKRKIVFVGTGTTEIPAKGWGAVEGIVWEYYTRFKRDYSDKYESLLVNDSQGNFSKMVMDINSIKPDIVHIFYDDRIDIVPFIECSTIIYTSHWAYLPQIDNKINTSYYRNIFKRVYDNKDKLKIFALSNDIITKYLELGIPSENLYLVNNGANTKSFRFSEECLYPDKAIYLGKIDCRKRQHLFQNIEEIIFVGNCIEPKFNLNNPRYLGEWNRPTVYQNLTHYATVVLLGDGEADPLVVKEGLVAGCGVVISDCSAANLDTTKPWITIIPENRITDKQEDLEYIRNQIIENMKISINKRQEIRNYGLKEFSWEHIIKNKYIPILNTL